jgi:hypothetical protein
MEKIKFIGIFIFLKIKGILKVVIPFLLLLATLNGITWLVIKFLRSLTVRELIDFSFEPYMIMFQGLLGAVFVLSIMAYYFLFIGLFGIIGYEENLKHDKNYKEFFFYLGLGAGIQVLGGIPFWLLDKYFDIIYYIEAYVFRFRNPTYYINSNILFRIGAYSSLFPFITILLLIIFAGFFFLVFEIMYNWIKDSIVKVKSFLKEDK